MTDASSPRRRRWPLVALGLALLLALGGGVALLAVRSGPGHPALVAARPGPPAAAPPVAPVVAASTPSPSAATSAAVAGATPGPARLVAPTKPAVRQGVSTDDPHPRLGTIAVPAWAQEPPKTTILHSTLSRINVYPYTKGQPPSADNGVLIKLNNPTLEGLTFTLAGFGETDGFYLALLDVRPNQTYGWVKASDVTVSSTPYRIEISESHHRLLLWDGDRVVGSFAVAVGKSSTPTPVGYFFVNTILKQANPAGDYGPWIVSSSGFSEVYDTFGDGDAAIGLHGSDEPLLIGQSVSHGCIRMYNSDITLMAATVPVGTLFEIHS